MATRFLLGLSLTLLSVLVASAVSTLPLAEEPPQRVALVIANANYPDASTPLPAAIHDAQKLAEELTRLNFDVSRRENLGRRDMQIAIDTFLKKIDPGMTALLYFAGFGLQVARQNYLIPVDVEIWSESDVRRLGVSVDAALAKMDRRRARTKIVILDTARLNPFERRFRTASAGLSALNAPEGTLAILAAAPSTFIHDSFDANSLFMNELIKELRVPDRTANEAFNATRIGVSRASNNAQVPWVTSSLYEPFSFGEPRSMLTQPFPPSR